MTETRIRWTAGPLGVNETGHVGTASGWLFQIFKASDDADDRTLVLMSALPGALGDYRRSEDAAWLKGEAERWLEGFVSSLGAVFADRIRKAAEAERAARYGGATRAVTDETAWRRWGWVDALDWVLALMDAPTTSAPVAGEE